MGAISAILGVIQLHVRAGVLYITGLDFQRALVDVEGMTRITRGKPALMVKGKPEVFFPAETSQ